MDTSAFSNMKTSIGRFFIFLGLGLMTGSFVLRGHVRVTGLYRALRAISTERLVIVCNHPSLLELFVIPGFFSPLYLIGRPNRIPWTISAAELLSRQHYWRCIPVDRDNAASRGSCLRAACRLLKKGSSMMLNPEGGRTLKGTEFVEYNGRRIRKTEGGALFLAQQTNTRILPIFVTFNIDKPLSVPDCIKHLQRGNQMTINFGAPHDASKMSNEELELLLLSTGL